MKTIPVFAVLLLTQSMAQAGQYSTSSLTEGRVADEIARHVIDECNLKRIYGKHRIDFDAIDVAANILPKIHKKHWKEKNKLTDKIISVVLPIRSFARRVRIYDVYYELCIGSTDVVSAQKEIMRYLKTRLSNEEIEDDSTVEKLYGTSNNRKRVARDQSRVRILERLNEVESRAHIAKKNSSVIQEYKHDIALWKF